MSQAGDHEALEHRKESSWYDCQFVDQPHDQLQTKCPVCLCVLRDPCMVDCCGYSFCHTCINIVQQSERPCPLCNEQFTSYPDKRLCRILKGMKVYCAHAEAGCDWQGELGVLAEHLNLDPSIDTKTTGCIYSKVPCDYCGSLMERRNISHHHLEDCQQRPYSCDYCCDYYSTCENVTVNHWLVCPSRPISCPNECGVYPEKKNLQRHLSEQCEMAVIKCHFYGVGCEVTVERRSMQTHLENNVMTHLSLQSQFYGNRFVQLEGKIKDCESEIFELKKENALLKSRVQLFQEDKNLAVDVSKCKINSVDVPTPVQCPLRSTGGQDEGTCLEELQQLKSLLCVPPLQFTIHSVSKLQNDKQKWLSLPFYTYSQGYLMCLKVYCGGHSSSEGFDLSVYVCMMKGQYDDMLTWPFRGSITLQLMDQLQLKEHIIRTVTFHEGVGWEFSGRVVDCVMSGGWGILRFASLNKLVPNYLQNDCLQIKVDKITVA